MEVNKELQVQYSKLATSKLCSTFSIHIFIFEGHALQPELVVNGFTYNDVGTVAVHPQHFIASMENILQNPLS